jgi:hypothetical protein
VILDAVTAKCFEDLDWSRTTLVDPKSDVGWLDRDGRFYGCERENHDLMARLLFKSEEHDLEERGWVRVMRSDLWTTGARHMGDGTLAYVRITDAQRQWLLDNGHTVTDQD